MYENLKKRITKLEKIAHNMDLLNALSDYAHSAWAGWMKYLFSKSTKNQDGSVTIPASLVERWERQMNTSYKDLPETEKESDKVEAIKIFKLLK